MLQAKRSVPGTGVIVAMVVGALLGSAACSSSASKSGSTSSGVAQGLPAHIKLISLKDLTGTAAFAGTSTNDGIKLAIQQINEQHYLGASTTIDLTSKDTAGSATTAASEASAAVADSGYAAILGPSTSAQAIAIAPIAQRAKAPVIFTQSGSAGVVVGDYTFRATAPMSSYYSLASTYLKSKNVKSLGVIYDTSYPTLSQLATDTLPQLAKQDGYRILSSTAVQASTTDFSAPITKVVSGKPDAVALLLVGAANPAAIQALRQAGFHGPVIGNAAAGAGNLKPAGKDGAGMTWPTDFSAVQTSSASGQTFVKAYEAANQGQAPLNYAAEGYDAAWWLARAIKASGSASRSGIQQGLTEVAKSGFTGAQGKITFDGNDMRVPGVLVQWNGSSEVLVAR